MAFDPETVRAARNILEQRRSTATARAAALRDTYTARFPRLLELERQIADTMPELTRVILEHGSPEQIEEIKQRNLALQDEMAALLKKAGCPQTNFEPVYTCSRCQDTGFVGGQICDCHRQLLREEACRRLSGLSARKLTDFDSMRLDYYDDRPDPQLGESPRQRMQAIIAYCRSYAEQFSPRATSLLLTGSTGVGKTHLCLAIAKTVTERGYGVVYGSIQPLLHKIESEHFGRSEGDSEESLIHCDLLVLDDLGMEFDTPFYRSCIYNLINARVLEERPTVISTNLSFTALKDRYGDQIASRLIGGFEPLLCVGQDIRQLIRRQSML